MTSSYHRWWTADAAGVALFYVVLIVQDPSVQAALAALCAAMVLAGIGMRSRHRAVGDVLLVVGVAPAVVAIWFWPVAVVALVVVVCAVTDLADARTLRRPGPLGRLAGAALVVAVLGTGVAWVAMLSVGGWVPVLVAGAALLGLLLLVVALGREARVA